MPKPMPVREQETPSRSESGEHARALSGGAVETVPRQGRRTFTAAEKLRIVQRAEACLASGQRGALEAMLREEGLYSSHLSKWRAQLGAHGAAGLQASRPGRKPKLDASGKLNAELVKRNARLERELHVVKALLALQKKAHELLGIALPESSDED